MLRFVVFLAALFAVAAPAAAADMRVRVLTNDFVLPGKFTKLAELARAETIALDAVNVSRAGGAPADWLAGTDLLIIDAPRPNDRAEVLERLAGAHEAEDGAPWVLIGGGPPAFGGIDPRQARTFIAYYSNGGDANMRHLFAHIRAWRDGGDTASIPPPLVLPKQGIYHPDAPAVFTAPEEYLAWGKDRWKTGAAKLALSIHDGYLSSMQTGPIDDIIRGAEERGLIPLAFWFDARDAMGLRSVLEPAGADMLLNLTHMQNGPARQEEFLALGIPVLQGLSHRMGTRDAWRGASSGVPMHMVAPFLSVTEIWGMSDPLVLDAVEDGEPVSIEEQVDLLLGKAVALGALRKTPAPEKRLALMFWNYPPGERNFSASNFNVPRSLEQLTAALADAGYDVPAADEEALIAAGQKMLAGFYRPETLPALYEEGLAAAFPVEAYEKWLADLPAFVREQMESRYGAAAASPHLHDVGGRQHFLIPRLALGKLLIMPQPPRSGETGASYHDGKEPPSHAYLATYLYLREAFAAHALIHFGTHGTQEWTPGKDRGLWAYDYPYLALGDLPVFYPYIQDNIAEAIQAKRRGRAVTVSHQTPPFAPAGLYDELRDLHDLIHEYEQLMEGAVREETASRIAALALSSGLAADMEWDEARIDADFDGFMRDMHDHLHVVAGAAMPLGLHTFGKAAAPEHRLTTVMQQLGRDFYARLIDDPDEMFADESDKVEESPAWAFLARYLREGGATEEIDDPELRAMVERGVGLDRHLADVREIDALLMGLAGGFVAPGSGGDPIRNPDVPNGRNLYAFEANKIPTRAAYESGGEAFTALVDAFREEHGRMPEKLAFSLWSSEALRHLGVLEAQVLHALGLRPVWDEGGRVVALDIIPSAELGRPRVDAVLQVTSVYRDQLDHFMRLLADAIERIAGLEEEEGNAVAQNAARIAAALEAEGIAPDEARGLAALRIFSNEPGDYGTGLPDATLASTEWEDDAPLAENFLARMRYAYGSSHWGETPAGANLLAEQLRGTDAAILSRSSNLHGVLSTDHPFEYLGGLALAVRHLDGKSPSLYISDLRDREPRLTTAARFLASELRSRYLNPAWIEGMKEEGYAGTLEMLNAVNNLWGWQVTAPETVRADQWQAVHDTYVADRRGLDLQEWFEAHNAAAQAQLIERLLEAIRKGYWDASDETRREIAERWQELQQQDVPPVAEVTREFAAQMAAGFGLSAAAPTAQGGETAASMPVQGQLMEPVAQPQGSAPQHWRYWIGLSLLAIFFMLGALRQLRTARH